MFGKHDPFEVDIEKAIDVWGDTVMRMALRRLCDESDAEDVFQNVFMRLYRHKESIRDPQHLKAWLLQATLNCCYDALCKRRSTLSLDEAGSIEATKGLTAQELALHAAVDALPVAIRTAIHLYYFEGYSAEEIAGITGEKPSTVRSHLFRGRKALQIAFGGDDCHE